MNNLEELRRSLLRDESENRERVLREESEERHNRANQPLLNEVDAS